MSAFVMVTSYAQPPCMIVAIIFDPGGRVANCASSAGWLFTLTPSRARTESPGRRPAFAAALPRVTLTIFMPMRHPLIQLLPILRRALLFGGMLFRGVPHLACWLGDWSRII